MEGKIRDVENQKEILKNSYEVLEKSFGELQRENKQNLRNKLK